MRHSKRRYDDQLPPELLRQIPAFIHKAWCGTEAEDRSLTFGHKVHDFFMDDDGIVKLGYICTNDGCESLVYLMPPGTKPHPKLKDDPEWAIVPASGTTGGLWSGTLIANACGWKADA